MRWPFLLLVGAIAAAGCSEPAPAPPVQGVQKAPHPWDECLALRSSPNLTCVGEWGQAHHRENRCNVAVAVARDGRDAYPICMGDVGDDFVQTYDCGEADVCALPGYCGFEACGFHDRHFAGGFRTIWVGNRQCDHPRAIGGQQWFWADASTLQACHTGDLTFVGNATQVSLRWMDAARFDGRAGRFEGFDLGRLEARGMFGVLESTVGGQSLSLEDATARNATLDRSGLAFEGNYSRLESRDGDALFASERADGVRVRFDAREAVATVKTSRLEVRSDRVELALRPVNDTFINITGTEVRLDLGGLRGYMVELWYHGHNETFTDRLGFGFYGDQDHARHHFIHGSARDKRLSIEVRADRLTVAPIPEPRPA